VLYVAFGGRRPSRYGTFFPISRIGKKTAELRSAYYIGYDTGVRHRRTTLRRSDIFTGLISQIGKVEEATRQSGGGMALSIEAAPPISGARPGASVAVNGVCLTVVNAGQVLTFDVVAETLSRSNLGELTRGDSVNLESSLRAGDEIGGHFMYGHVDATTVVLARHDEGLGCRLWCVTPPALERFIAEKGSISLDGVSLTIAQIAEGEFAVALIPETLTRTTLGGKDAGSVLNVEVDPIARYVAHILGNNTR
jgi:riboflavin synthase